MPSVAQRQYTFGVGPFKFAHNFLVLYDDQGNVVAELHGLAKDPVTGEFRPRGRSSDNLHVIERVGKTGLNLDGQSEQVLWQGPEDATSR